MIRSLTVALVLLCVLPGVAASAGVDHSYRYVAGSYSERALASDGGSCSASRVWDGDSFADVPLVVGGACQIAVAGASAISVSVADDAWSAVPGVTMQGVAFRWQLWGGSAPHVTCAQGGTAWGSVHLVVPPGCDSLSVFLGQGATTGTISVVGA